MLVSFEAMLQSLLLSLPGSEVVIAIAILVVVAVVIVVVVVVVAVVVVVVDVVVVACCRDASVVCRRGSLSVVDVIVIVLA